MVNKFRGIQYNTADNRIVCPSTGILERLGDPASPNGLHQHQWINVMSLENWVFNSPDGYLRIKTKG